ncbi:MAG: beta-ketoacyl-[acyl-carrier-protein] synthase family protein [Bacteroidales bacterium]|nr:beta-ketoacyl-[acyl-carrier-protein] synthase family protein [Bacteroidales bacterium]
MSERVFVTGTGIVSAIGFDCEETASALKLSASGIGRITHLNTVYKEEIPVAEVKATDKELMEMAGIQQAGFFSRTTLLGIIAARQALLQADIKDIKAYKTGMVSATTVGGMDRSERFFKKFIIDNSRGRLRDIITHDCGDSTERIADTLGIKDYLATISTACSSSANAILLGSRLIKNGILDRVIVGGTDALTLFTLNGFNSLMILDKNGCKPFDEERNGLTLGEGAGFLVIESERSVRKDHKEVLCEITGYGNACDAFHQTASSPEGEGAYLSMKKALDVAGLEPGRIDYINAHGTGTKNNDLSEGIAIERLFDKNVPLCSSTKSFTGHTLGAAGAIEAVLCVMAIRNRWIYPNLFFRQKMTELAFSPVTDFQYNKPVRHVMSNSFGFGGNNTSLIFSGS